LPTLQFAGKFMGLLTV